MASPSPTPRKWKNQLIPHIIDGLAQTAPTELYAEYPISTLTYSQGYRKINYKDFANAINGAAAWMIENLGEPKTPHEVLAYIGPNDLRYAVLILGAVKAGYVVSFVWFCLSF